MSFYYRTTTTWNNLPKSVVDAANIDTFKARFDLTYSDSATKFTLEKRQSDS